MTGQPTYLELGVPDADAARRFYGQLLGWQPGGHMGGGNVSTSSLDVGIHGNDPGAELLVFFSVDDLDASIADLTRLGGHIHGDIVSDEGFGRFAVCTDNQGVRFALHQAT